MNQRSRSGFVGPRRPQVIGAVLHVVRLFMAFHAASMEHWCCQALQI